MSPPRTEALACPGRGPVHWIHALVAVSGRHYVEIALGAYLAWLKVPWWLTAMRLATTRDAAKAEHLAKRLEAIEPHWHWIWQRRGLSAVEQPDGFKGDRPRIDPRRLCLHYCPAALFQFPFVPADIFTFPTPLVTWAGTWPGECVHDAGKPPGAPPAVRHAG
jgi:hypothetical protein